MVSFTKLFTAGLVATSAIAAPAEVKRGSSSKRGAAYNDVSTVSALTNGGTVSWAYNWAGSLSGNLPNGVEFVPMLWGAKDFGGWATTIQTILSSGTNYILGFNEPDIEGQASMSPTDAATNYRTHITPYNGQAKLISPAVSSSTNDGQGLSWFSQFIQQCSDCKITGLAVHWYGEGPEDFKAFVQKAMKTASDNGLSELWLTEFALAPGGTISKDPAAIATFLKDVIPWLDGQSGVTRYSYFMCANTYLLNGQTLNQAGQAYIS